MDHFVYHIADRVITKSNCLDNKILEYEVLQNICMEALVRGLDEYDRP